MDTFDIVKRIQLHDGKWMEIENNNRVVSIIVIADERRTVVYMRTVFNEYGETENFAFTMDSKLFIQTFTEKPHECCVCGTTENLHKDGWYGYRCDSINCMCY